MKKLKKLTLKEVQESSELIPENNLKSFTGGDGVIPREEAVSESDYQDMMLNGEWEGGWYTDSAGNEYYKAAQDTYSGSEMDAMMDSGEWEGGYVDGMGYVTGTVCCFGSGSGYITSGSELINGMTQQGLEHALGIAWGFVPFSAVTDFYLNELAKMRGDFATAVWDNGNLTSSSCYVVTETSANGEEHNICLYDQNGNQISSGTMKVSGWHINK